MIETAGAILRQDGRILLGLRAGHRSFADCWDIIGGHLETGETPWSALCRELSEEIGITALAGVPLSTLVTVEPATRLHVFSLARWNGDPALCNDEHRALRWFTVAEALQLSNLALPDYRALFSSLA